ncbi:MAG: VOC family protein [Thermomicrobiales bacterium]
MTVPFILSRAILADIGSGGELLRGSKGGTMVAARLDHVFVLVDREDLASIPAEQGFPVLRRGPHQGGGTANVVYRFGDVLLELAYPLDRDELARLGKIGFAERWRWRENGYSPFGVVFEVDASSGGRLPFQTWSYAPPFLPGACWTIGAASPVEPLYMVSAELSAVRQPVHDPQFVAVLVSCPGLNCPSPVSQALGDWNICTIRSGSRVGMEWRFASESAATLDLRPAVPLVLRNVRDESVTVEGGWDF